MPFNFHQRRCACVDQLTRVHSLRLFFKNNRFSDFLFEVFILSITTDTIVCERSSRFKTINVTVSKESDIPAPNLIHNSYLKKKSYFVEANRFNQIVNNMLNKLIALGY